jgi:hypothetical protein
MKPNVLILSGYLGNGPDLQTTFKLTRENPLIVISNIFEKYQNSKLRRKNRQSESQTEELKNGNWRAKE